MNKWPNKWIHYRNISIQSAPCRRRSRQISGVRSSRGEGIRGWILCLINNIFFLRWRGTCPMPMVATPLLKSYWTHIPLRSFQKAVTVERQSGVIGGRWDRGMKIYIGVFLQSMPIVMLWVTGEEDKRTGKCTNGTSCRTVDVELLTFLGQLLASVCSLLKNMLAYF